MAWVRTVTCKICGKETLYPWAKAVDLCHYHNTTLNRIKLKLHLL